MIVSNLVSRAEGFVRSQPIWSGPWLPERVSPAVCSWVFRLRPFCEVTLGHQTANVLISLESPLLLPTCRSRGTISALYSWGSTRHQLPVPSTREIQRTIMFSQGFFTSQLEKAIGWARKYSLFQYPFVTACCGMEYMATASSHYDIDRFGAGFPRFSPRQRDSDEATESPRQRLTVSGRAAGDPMVTPR